VIARIIAPKFDANLVEVAVDRAVIEVFPDDAGASVGDDPRFWGAATDLKICSNLNQSAVRC
jgi:hypothetical protein